jgi:alpha-glucosidase
MKALTESRFAGREGIWAVFELPFGMRLRVGLLERDLGRVILQHSDGYRLDRGWSIAPGGLEPPYAGRQRDDLNGFTLPHTKVTETHGAVTLACDGGLAVDICLNPFSIAWRRPSETEPFLRDRPTQAYFVSRRTGKLQHFMARHADERHYGLGDKTGPLDRTGRRWRIDAVDPCGYDAEISDPLYKMVPMFLVDGPHGAHGIFYDNLAIAEVDLGCTIDNYHGLFRSYCAEDGDLDYYIMAGPTIPDVVRRFSWLTGGQAFPPRWSLGFGLTSMTILDAADADSRITAFIEDCHRHEIPCDSFHFGSGFTSRGARRYAFNWNREKFPDPAATLARLRAAGMTPVANLKPCLLDDHPRIGEARDERLLVEEGKGAEPAVAQFWDGLGFHLDFTNPRARAWWRSGIERALLEPGMAAVWNDNNEYEIWDEDAVCHGDGRPFPQSLARPAQATLMMKVAHEAQVLHAPEKRPYVITRAGSAGIWRYGQTWSGDNETAWKTLRYNLTQGLNMSLSGMFNIGHDVGGFHGPVPDPELFCRFVEFCSMWPRFVMNSWKDAGIVNQPWMHPAVLAQVRAAIRLRYRLLPYHYTRMWRASLADEPVVRPLFYDFGADTAALRVEDSFMVGPDLLVAPVLQAGVRERSLYLPVHAGGWYDLHDGALYEGGAIVTVPAPLGRLPIFARAGALIPTCEDSKQRESRVLLVFGSAPRPSSADLYEDDGELADWRSGGLHLGFTREPATGAASISMNESGSYRPPFRHIAVRTVGGAQVRLVPAAGSIQLIQADDGSADG